MKVFVTCAAMGALLGGGKSLATKYTAERAFKIEISSSTSMETTSMQMEIDGEPQEDHGSGSKSVTERAEVLVDHVMEVADGKPTKIRRTFEKVGGKSSFEMGERSGENALESPFQGLTLEITMDKDGKPEFKTVDGKGPDDEKAYEGQRANLFLDGLLPKGEVEVDASWDLEKDAIVHALRLDVQKGMYPPPERGEGGGGRGGGGGGGGGRRGPGGMGGGDNGMATADWKGTGKLVALDKDVDGVKCAMIEVKLEASGERDLPEPRRREEKMYGPETLGDNTMSFDYKLEGALYVTLDGHHPVKLALEGSVRNETNSNRTMGDRKMKMHMVRDGKLEYAVEISEAAAKAAEKPAEKAAK